MMGWGLVVAENSSAAAAVAAPGGGEHAGAVVGPYLYAFATTIRVCYYYKSLLLL